MQRASQARSIQHASVKPHVGIRRTAASARWKLLNVAGARIAAEVKPAS